MSRLDDLRKEKEQVLAKQEPVNTITLDFLREKVEILDRTAESLQTQAGQTGDVEIWDAARFTRGEASAYRDLIAHVKGLSHREYLIQLREGRL